MTRVPRPEFRRSQAIVPHGVGAIIDFPNESLMAAGLDAWLVETAQGPIGTALRHATLVSDARLRARLTHQLGRRIKALYSPPEAPEQPSGSSSVVPTSPAPPRGYTPFIRFPLWHFCLRCRAMQKVPWNASTGDERTRCINPHFRRLGTEKTKSCADLPAKRRPILVPVRFIAACHRGHIEDFPWPEWAHSGRRPCDSDTGTLFLVSTGGAGLAGIKVECRCGSGRTMQGAFTPDTFANVTGRLCGGERPWLGPDGCEPCDKQLHVVQRGASNVYFPQVVNSILIPPHSQPLHRVLDDPIEWSKIAGLLDGFYVNGKPPAITPHMFKDWAERLGLDPSAFAEAVCEKYLYPDRWAGEVEDSEEPYRYAERQAFLGPRPAQKERKEFDLHHLDQSSYEAPLNDLLAHVVLLPRLRETRALTGFSRLVPMDGSDNQLAPLSRATLSWVPAVSVSGEGIYFELDADKLARWEGEWSSLVKRIALLDQHAATIAAERGTTHVPVSPRLVLAHTMSHLLIRQLAFSCGYDTSSLKERLYVSTNDEQAMCGVLIYTASGDSEGSLGGLVRQGEPGRFEATFSAAIRNAVLCASDPLCYESTGQGYYGLNLAACHACTLLPETACELGNKWLDRQLVVGAQDVSERGFCSPLLSKECCNL